MRTFRAEGRVATTVAYGICPGMHDEPELVLALVPGMKGWSCVRLDGLAAVLD
jgi:hypothetical protein